MSAQAAPVCADEDAVEAIAEKWLRMDPHDVPMGGAIGRVSGAAREAYAAGRASAFKDAEAAALYACCDCGSAASGHGDWCHGRQPADAIARAAKEGSR